MLGIVEGGCTEPRLPSRWLRVALLLGVVAGLALVLVR